MEKIFLLASLILLIAFVFAGLFLVYNITVDIYEYFVKIPYKIRLIQRKNKAYYIEEKRTVISRWKQKVSLGYCSTSEAVRKFRIYIEDSKIIRMNHVICEQKVKNIK